MHLLHPKRMLEDEGLQGVLVPAMRRQFVKYREHLQAVRIIARPRYKQDGMPASASRQLLLFSTNYSTPSSSNTFFAADSPDWGFWPVTRLPSTAT